jgi:tape measure domain-containing protein
MASIKTSIELYDNFSDPMMDIVNAANAGTIAIENVQSAMNAGVDMSGINRATAAMQSFENTMQAIEAPSFSFGDVDTTLPDLGGATPNITVPVIPVVESQPQIDVPDGINVPVTAEVVEQPRIDVPTGIEVPVSAEITEQPQIDVPDGINVPVELSGVSESEKQIQDISTRLNNILNYQNAINNVGRNLFVMPGDSAAEITGINRELGQMQTALDYLKTNPFDLDSSVAQLQLGSLSSAIDNVIERQERLNDLMGNVPSQVYSATPTVQDAPQVEPTQAPVNVPFNWQADNMNVFENTGIERFQQEIESANTMLNALNDTQQRIAETAASVDLFPANAVTDLSGMQTRLQAIQDRIVQIENNPLNMGTNAANSELEQLRGQLDQAVQAQQALNSAVDNMDVQAANDAYLRLSQTVSGTERYIRDNVDEQGRFNQKINEGTANADNLMNTIKSAVATYATVQTAGVVFDLSDTLTSTTARLSMMNDGVQTTSELINMVYAAAQDARGSFDQMADVVARFGNNARDAFGSSEEVVAFADLIQKQMTIAGASTQEAANAELQLSQALGSGVLRGDELNSIFEQAPNLIQNIADYLDVPIGQIREMAADGKLSANVVKAAIFSAADDINSKFESMPQTFAQIWTSSQNTALMSFQPVLNRLNEIANSDAFQQFVNNAIGGLSAVASVSLEILNFLVNVAYVVANNWSWISPIIGGVTAALMAYYGSRLAVNAVDMIGNGIHLATAAVMMIHAAATGTLTAATAAEIAAQNGLNGALLACPITWIVMGVIALIAVLLAVTNAIAQVTGVTQSGVGIITGVIAVGGAFILNTIISLINSVITLGVSFWNMLANFAAAFGLIFNDPIAAIEVMFLSLFNFIVSIVSSAAGILDTIFGSDLQSAVQGFQDKIQAQINTTVENAGSDKPKTLDPSDYTMDRISYGDAFSMGADFGDGVVGGISDFFNKTFNMDSIAPSVDLSDYTAGIGDGVKDIAGNTGAIKNSLDITDEDLKYLRDIAEQEVINRFTTAEVKIDMSGMNNNISNGMDLDGVVSVMAEGVAEAIDTAAEGVHE